MRFISFIIILTLSFSIMGVETETDLGQISREVLVSPPLRFSENLEKEVDELYSRQIQEVQFDQSDFSTRKWRTSRLQKVLNNGRHFEDYDEKNNLIIGKFVAVKGEVCFPRKWQDILKKEWAY